MAVTLDMTYDGNLHLQITHGPSGATLSTDAPVDNGGKGESFSPTDLVAAALGSCLVTVMGLVAKRNELDIAGTRVRVVKEMVQQPVRRIGALIVTITVPAAKAAKLSESDRTRMQNAALHCPVHQSLHPDVKLPIEFVYET